MKQTKKKKPVGGKKTASLKFQISPNENKCLYSSCNAFRDFVINLQTELLFIQGLVLVVCFFSFSKTIFAKSFLPSILPSLLSIFLFSLLPSSLTFFSLSLLPSLLHQCLRNTQSADVAGQMWQQQPIGRVLVKHCLATKVAH